MITKTKIVTLIFMATLQTTFAQSLDFEKVRSLEHQLHDVMELIDLEVLKERLADATLAFEQDPSELNQIRLGIVYHEAALNFNLLSNTERGYAQKSYNLLHQVHQTTTTAEWLPFISAYEASALALVAAETRKLKQLAEAFQLFEVAVKQFDTVSPMPRFLRGSVAENLPWYFFSKRRAARDDFDQIIFKYEQNNQHANARVMSFTYWAWANQYRAKKHRKQALEYLNTAIALDPHGTSGRERAVKLKQTWER